MVEMALLQVLADVLAVWLAFELKRVLVACLAMEAGARYRCVLVFEHQIGDDGENVFVDVVHLGYVMWLTLSEKGILF